MIDGERVIWKAQTPAEDAKCAAAVKDAVEQINAALGSAHSAGLAVTVETREVHYVGARHPRIIVSATVMRPL